MFGNNKNSIGIPFFGIVYIVSVIVVAIQHFSGFDFGTLGIICWIIVIVGAVGFVIYVIGLALKLW